MPSNYGVNNSAKTFLINIAYFCVFLQVLLKQVFKKLIYLKNWLLNYKNDSFPKIYFVKWFAAFGA